MYLVSERNGEPMGGIKQGGEVERTQLEHLFTQEVISMFMERILSWENLLNAIKRVEKNKGKHGVDEMPVTAMRGHILLNWSELRQSLIGGTYIPSPVRRVEILKPDGKGKRKLGILTVTDRFIQQAITQVHNKMYDPSFSECSFGFRPIRRAHDAVKLTQSYIEEGYRWEGRKIKKSDVDLDSGTLFIRKNKAHRERIVPMSDDIRNFCIDYNEKLKLSSPKSEYFFPNPDGIPYSAKWLTRQFLSIWERIQPAQCSRRVTRIRSPSQIRISCHDELVRRRRRLICKASLPKYIYGAC